MFYGILSAMMGKRVPKGKTGKMGIGAMIMKDKRKAHSELIAGAAKSRRSAVSGHGSHCHSCGDHCPHAIALPSLLEC